MRTAVSTIVALFVASASAVKLEGDTATVEL